MKHNISKLCRPESLFNFKGPFIRCIYNASFYQKTLFTTTTARAVDYRLFDRASFRLEISIRRYTTTVWKQNLIAAKRTVKCIGNTF